MRVHHNITYKIVDSTEITTNGNMEIEREKERERAGIVVMIQNPHIYKMGEHHALYLLASSVCTFKWCDLWDFIFCEWKRYVLFRSFFSYFTGTNERMNAGRLEDYMQP